MIVPFLYFSVFHLFIWGFNKDFSHSTVSSFLSLKLVKLAGSGPVQWKNYNRPADSRDWTTSPLRSNVPLQLETLFLAVSEQKTTPLFESHNLLSTVQQLWVFMTQIIPRTPCWEFRTQESGPLQKKAHNYILKCVINIIKTLNIYGQCWIPCLRKQTILPLIYGNN